MLGDALKLSSDSSKKNLHTLSRPMIKKFYFTVNSMDVPRKVLELSSNWVSKSWCNLFDMIVSFKLHIYLCTLNLINYSVWRTTKTAGTNGRKKKNCYKNVNLQLRQIIRLLRIMLNTNICTLCQVKIYIIVAYIYTFNYIRH